MKETVLLLLDHDHLKIKMERAASLGKTPKGTSRAISTCRKIGRIHDVTLGTNGIVSSTKPKKAAVKARSVLSCMQKKAGRERPSNKASIGMVRHVEKLGCVSQDFYLFFTRTPNTVILRKAKDPRAQISNCGILQPLNISSKFGKSEASTSTLFGKEAQRKKPMGTNIRTAW